ncbi:MULTISPECIES: hypothetical protein [unclassified Bradyrhizobium]|uniref:hypothetical protein n=1 Tax=unclassified Bradyrhizobium TaxID=2631580 RepID=UPI003207B86E
MIDLSGDAFQVNIAQRFSARLAKLVRSDSLLLSAAENEFGSLCRPSSVWQAHHCIEFARAFHKSLTRRQISSKARPIARNACSPSLKSPLTISETRKALGIKLAKRVGMKRQRRHCAQYLCDPPLHFRRRHVV